MNRPESDRSARDEDPWDLGPPGEARPSRAPAWGGLIIAAGLAAVVACCSLQREPERAKVRFRAQADEVKAVAFAPGGREVVVGRADGALEVQAVDGGRAREFLPPAPRAGEAVRCVAFSPDGETLASGGRDRAIALWDFATGRLRAELAGHSCAVCAVAFSPDGKTLASGGLDGSIRLWDLATGLERARLDGHDLDIRGLAFSPDGKTLASGSYDGSIRLWDAADGRPRGALRGTDHRVYGLAFSPDGKTLAAGVGASKIGVKGAIMVWDMGRPGARGRVLGPASLSTVAFAPDGKTLASGGGERVVRLWDLATGQGRATLEGHEGYIGALCFSPDGKTLATGGQDHLLGLFAVPEFGAPAPAARL